MLTKMMFKHNHIYLRIYSNIKWKILTMQKQKLHFHQPNICEFLYSLSWSKKKKKVIIEEVFTGQENMKLKKIEETSCGIFSSSFQNTDRVFIL